MTDLKRLVLDANILLRAVFEVRVRDLLETYEDIVSFYAADVCFADDGSTSLPSPRNAELILAREFSCSIICRV
jgi:hypothetical protein